MKFRSGDFIFEFTSNAHYVTDCRNSPCSRDAGFDKFFLLKKYLSTWICYITSLSFYYQNYAHMVVWEVFCVPTIYDTYVSTNTKRKNISDPV